MIYKQREMTGELRLLHALDRRLTLSPKDRKNYLHLLKGLKGERRFDKLLNKPQMRPHSNPRFITRT